MRKLGLIAAMEAEQAIEDAAVDAGVVGGADNLESSMIDSNEAGDVVEGQMDDVDSTIDDNDQLIGHAEIMEDSLENGGMTVDAARTAELAVESIYARLGVTRRQAMPAMESFGEKGNRIAATKLALESVMDSIKSIFESVKAFIIKMGAYIKDFLMKLFDANTKLGERAAKMTKSVAEMTVKTTTAVDLKSAESIAKGLSMEGKLSPTTLISEIKTAAEEIAKTQRLADGVAEWISKMKPTIAELTVIDVTSGASVVGTAEGFEAPSDNMSSYRNDCLPGNMAVIARSPTDKALKGVDAASAISKTYVKVGSYYGNKPAPKCEKVPVLKYAEMVSLVASVVELQKSVVKSKAVADKVNQARASLVEKIKNLAKVFVDQGPKALSDANKMAGVLSSINKLTATSITSMSKYAVATGKTCLDYVEKSAKEYKAGTAEAKTE